MGRVVLALYSSSQKVSAIRLFSTKTHALHLEKFPSFLVRIKTRNLTERNLSLGLSIDVKKNLDKRLCHQELRCKVNHAISHTNLLERDRGDFLRGTVLRGHVGGKKTPVSRSPEPVYVCTRIQFRSTTIFTSFSPMQIDKKVGT